MRYHKKIKELEEKILELEYENFTLAAQPNLIETYQQLIAETKEIKNKYESLCSQMILLKQETMKQFDDILSNQNTTV